ncbi:MAG: CvpA family protein [Gammaproteobacteria bacterium]|nr:CvpA family protein [Gammaproteobacteria bacterium]
MSWVDYIILAIIVASALIGLFRGFLRETVSLLTWIVGFWVALRFARQLGNAFGFIHNPSARVIIGFVLLFILILILGTVVNYFIGKLVKKTGAGTADRALGVLFGLVRGVVVVAVLALLAGFTLLPRNPAWHESRLVPYAESVAGWIRYWLPGDVAHDMLRGGETADTGHK